MTMSSIPGCCRASEPFRKEAEFSLYSTDSENQVASVHHGLDRCAALLKTLLSPESHSLPKNTQQNAHRMEGKRTASKHTSHPPMKLLKHGTTHSVLQTGKTSPAGSAKPSVDARFPGAIKHLHATSTPAIRHSRSKTEPRSIVASKSLTAHSSSVGRVLNAHQEQNSRKGKQRSTRNYVTACRRLRTDLSGAATKESGTQTEPAVSIMPANGKHGLLLQDFQHSKQSLPTSIAAGKTATVNPNTAVPAQVRSHHAVQPHVQVPPHRSYPLHTPAFPQLHPYPYDTYSAPIPYTLYHPTLAGQYGPAVCNLQLFPSSTSSVQREQGNTRLGSLRSPSHTNDPQCVTEVQQSLGSLASKNYPHFRFEGKRNTEKGGSSQAGLSSTQTASRTEANQLMSNNTVVPTSKHSKPVQHSANAAAADLKSNTVHLSEASTTADTSQEIQFLMQEMLTTFQFTVGKIRGSVGTANSDLFEQLESLENSLKCYLEQLAKLCLHPVSQETSTMMESTGHSITDWLQLQQLEEEKSHLLERVIKSEMAYSETQGLLDQTKMKLQSLQDELDSQKLQVSSVIKEMHSSAEAFSSLMTEKKSLEEELRRVKAMSAESTGQLDVKNAVLQQQINCLEQEVSKTKEETRVNQDQLSTTKCSLDTAQEEIQMTKLSLSEKETELLQAQDQLLGLRQCVAYFCSELAKLGPSQMDSSHHMEGYYISEEAGQRLQGLVNSGSVDSFLATYMSRNSTPVMSHNRLQESSERSPTAAAAQDPETLNFQSPSQFETQVVDDSNCLPNSSIGDQKWSETKSSGSTVSLLRAVKPLKFKSTTTCKHSSFRNHHFSEPFSPRSATSDLQSTLTSSSELEFRKDLASLDADIARLQMQFRVAVHHPQQAPHSH